MRWLPCSCENCLIFDFKRCTRLTVAPLESRGEWAEKVAAANVPKGGGGGGGGGSTDDDSATAPAAMAVDLPRPCVNLASASHNTKRSDANVLERAERLANKLRLQGNIFVYYDEPDVSESLGIARVLSKPRDIKQGGEVVSGEFKVKRGASSRVLDVVLYKAIKVDGAVIYELPPVDAAWCSKRTDRRGEPGCDCGKWHSEVVYLAAVRRPINFTMSVFVATTTDGVVAAKTPKSKRKAKPQNGEAQRFAVPDQALQSALEDVVADRQLLRPDSSSTKKSGSISPSVRPSARPPMPSLVTSAADEIESDDEAEGSHNSSDDAMVVDSSDEPSHDHDVDAVDETSAAADYISPAGTDDSAALPPPPSVPGAAPALAAVNDTALADCSV